ALVQIFKGNVPIFFASEELAGFLECLDAQETGAWVTGDSAAERYFVVENINTIVACGGFYIPADESVATMVWGMVDNKFHKQGFGKLLLEYRIQQIKNINSGIKILLDTTQFSAPFFEKLGFKTWKITEDFYAKGLHRYDMELS
ncbi:MAG: GNAT family N-acetyltransferase, partial [Sphingobacteriales bacterium]